MPQRIEPENDQAIELRQPKNHGENVKKRNVYSQRKGNNQRAH